MTNAVWLALFALAAFALEGALSLSPAQAQADMPALQTNSSQFVELRPRSDAPQLSLERLDGKSMRLDAFRGKVILMAFWATWCPPCRRELRSLQRLRAQANPRKLEIVPISVDTQGKNAVAGFLQRMDVNELPIYLDNRQKIAARADAEANAPFTLYGMPITYVIDKNGSVVGYITGEVDWTSPEAMSFLTYFTEQ
ncbi:TlpA disulfide reductase family protein [Methylocystis sp. Sn-Cys]|uniref:TlpA disulfide reductase family protein n=1 Tax=Methylocystis sp. Sn-Cys TaxID=1701263 RepID=UPI001921A6AF|nr:TlpA disulfide reductase family protein [Methylocystis sp. Sn-Cys]MBL1255610.1 TlpA family protein disulfide reductase [Methylocystis sp. Sn-Cys]